MRRILSADEVRETIARAGVGQTPREKLDNVASRVAASSPTLYNYQRDGAKKGAINALLCHLAAEHGVIEKTPELGNILL
jgi:hypothetical protein